jgi:DNA polymerase-1
VISNHWKNIYETASPPLIWLRQNNWAKFYLTKLKWRSQTKENKKNGQYATGEEVLSYLANDNPIVKDILNWRQLIKLQNLCGRFTNK